MAYNLRYLYLSLVCHILWCDNVENTKKDDNLLPHSEYSKIKSSDGPESRDIPIIVWWTNRLYTRKMSGTSPIQCPDSNCLSAVDRKYLDDKRTRGFMFYGTDIDPEDMPLPRKPQHEWALLHEESPMNNYMITHTVAIKLFNHTSTFRRESDFPITSHHLPSAKYLIERKPVSIDIKNQYKKKHGFASVVFIQSHCDIASDRDRYVLELMKYIDIDSYGTCAHNKDLPENLRDPVESMHSEEFLNYISNYKFHLSFENAICKDYMTEKLFRTLHVGAVPVYKGSPLVKDWMPSTKAVIVVDDFESPQKLAEYINYLDSDDEKYLEYLEYKSKGVSNSFLLDELETRPYSSHGVIPHAIDGMPKPDMLHAFECYVCDEISKRMKHEQEVLLNPSVSPMPPKVGKKDHLHCPQPYTSFGDPEDYPVSDSWMYQNWIDDYWTGLDKALALERMMLTNETDSKKFQKYWNEVLFENPRYSSKNN